MENIQNNTQLSIFHSNAKPAKYLGRRVLLHVEKISGKGDVSIIMQIACMLCNQAFFAEEDIFLSSLDEEDFDSFKGNYRFSFLPKPSDDQTGYEEKYLKKLEQARLIENLVLQIVYPSRGLRDYGINSIPTLHLAEFNFPPSPIIQPHLSNWNISKSLGIPTQETDKVLGILPNSELRDWANLSSEEKENKKIELANQLSPPIKKLIFSDAIDQSFFKNHLIFFGYARDQIWNRIFMKTILKEFTHRNETIFFILPGFESFEPKSQNDKQAQLLFSQDQKSCVLFGDLLYQDTKILMMLSMPQTLCSGNGSLEEMISLEKQFCFAQGYHQKGLGKILETFFNTTIIPDDKVPNTTPFFQGNYSFEMWEQLDASPKILATIDCLISKPPEKKFPIVMNSLPPHLCTLGSRFFVQSDLLPLQVNESKVIPNPSNSESVLECTPLGYCFHFVNVLPKGVIKSCT